MNAILFKNGVYVLMKGIDVDDEDAFFKSSDVVTDKKSGMFRLYGGRVTGRVYTHYYCVKAHINIDGFEIENEGSDERTVAYLNQIEQLGVDTFLENYKKVVAEKKEYVSSMCDKLVSELQVEDDEDKREMLKRLRSQLEDLVGLLFLLMISMNAGLDNKTYTDAQIECENLISEYATDANQ